ncbi:hypothetical protein Bca4012_034259 [Brassica carinata]
MADICCPRCQEAPSISFFHASMRMNLETICFTDASREKSSKRSGLAWVFKDTRTKINHKESKIHDFVSSPLMAEAMAIRPAASLGISSIHVRSDSQTLIKAITNKQFQKEIYGILAYME